MLVEVYKNLHRGCLSIRHAPRGRVFDHRDEVVLQGATFFVGAGGRERVRREKQKNVHAFVRGTIAREEGLVAIGVAYYNPYTCEGFEWLGHRIHHWPMVRISERGVELL